MGLSAVRTVKPTICQPPDILAEPILHGFHSFLTQVFNIPRVKAPHPRSTALGSAYGTQRIFETCGDRRQQRFSIPRSVRVRSNYETSRRKLLKGK